MVDVPKAWRKGAKVDRPEDSTVRVALKVPVLVPSLKTNIKITSEAGTVIEDEPLPASAGCGCASTATSAGRRAWSSPASWSGCCSRRCSSGS